MTWGRAAALAVGVGSFFWILWSVGIGTVAQDVALAGLALPLAGSVHVLQLYLSGCAWRAAMGRIGLSRLQVLRFRWIREGVNTLVPTAQIGGQVVAVRMLVAAGVTPTLAVAGTILDLTLEAASQVIVILVALAMLLLQRDDRVWFVWMEGALGATALGVGALIAAQRLGLLRLVEAALERAALRWPATADWSMAGLHTTLMRRQADWRALLSAVMMHGASWSLGALEVWILLRALGHGVGLGPAFIIETLGMAARSAGFAVPGALGVQEGGFVLVCGLFGIGAETALAVSLLKRLRELAIGVVAVVAWQLAPGRVRSSHTVP